MKKISIAIALCALLVPAAASASGEGEQPAGDRSEAGAPAEDATASANGPDGDDAPDGRDGDDAAEPNATVAQSEGTPAEASPAAEAQPAPEPAPAPDAADESITESGDVEKETRPYGVEVELSNSIGFGTFVGPEHARRASYEIGLSVTPHYMVYDAMKLSAVLAVTRSVVTNADDTAISRPGQTRLEDLIVSFDWAPFYTIEGTGLSLSAGVDLVAPTSLVSQTQTLILAPRARLGLTGKWDWFSAAYRFRFTKYFHEATTPESPDIISDGFGTCVRRKEDPAGCHSGFSNPAFQLYNTLTLTATPLEGLSVYVMFGIWNTFRYNDHPERDELTSVNAVPGQTQRDSTRGILGVSYSPLEWLSLDLYTDTVQTPKTLDNKSFRIPILNFENANGNYTSLNFNLTGTF